MEGYKVLSKECWQHCLMAIKKIIRVTCDKLKKKRRVRYILYVGSNVSKRSRARNNYNFDEYCSLRATSSFLFKQLVLQLSPIPDYIYREEKLG